MPFPVSAHGTISVRASNFDRVITAVEKAIRDAKPTEVSRSGAEIRFRAGLLRVVPNWNQLVAIGSGELRFLQERGEVHIHYCISFMQLLVAVTLMVGLVFGVLPIAAGADPRSATGFLLPAWLWLFGGNYITTLFRFPRYLRRAAETADSNAVSHGTPSA